MSKAGPAPVSAQPPKKLLRANSLMSPLMKPGARFPSFAKEDTAMKISKIQLLIFSLIVLALGGGALFWLKGAPPRQQAQQFHIHDEASFNAGAKTFHETPFNDYKLEFDILLPQDWAVERLAKTSFPAAGQNIPEDVIRFKSPMIGTEQAVITIQSMRLDHEISAENWLKNYAYMNNYSVQEKVKTLGG